jgi:hypothetical protein
MATTSVPIRATEPASPEPLVATSVVSMSTPKSQPLWRFALIGLGPLSAMGVFALLVAWFQRVG